MTTNSNLVNMHKFRSGYYMCRGKKYFISVDRVENDEVFIDDKNSKRINLIKMDADTYSEYIFYDNTMFKAIDRVEDISLLEDVITESGWRSYDYTLRQLINQHFNIAVHEINVIANNKKIDDKFYKLINISCIKPFISFHIPQQQVLSKEEAIKNINICLELNHEDKLLIPKKPGYHTFWYEGMNISFNFEWYTENGENKRRIINAIGYDPYDDDILLTPDHIKVLQESIDSGIYDKALMDLQKMKETS